MIVSDFLGDTKALYILQKIFNKDKSWFYLNDQVKIPSKFFQIYEQIKNGYPLEYIFNEVEFYGDVFYIEEGVLIPRDDTEIVVEHAIEIVNNLCKKKECTVVDCCTGSGVIAIEIAKHTCAKVIATDISDKALSVAEKNITQHNVAVDIKKCDLLNCGGSLLKCDVLVANPPYVENSWKKPNSYEPDLAFYGGDDGLNIIKKLFYQAKTNGTKYAVLEIGYNQKKPLEKFFSDENCIYSFFNDLQGNVRGVVIDFKR